MIVSTSIIIPAGGRSARMGAANKLLLRLDGRHVLEHVVDAAVDSDPLEVIVVSGSDRDGVTKALGSRDVLCIHNPDFEEGMASSIRAGVRAASAGAAGYAILLADLPFVRAETIRFLGEHLTPERIVVPTHRGERGHPVLFGREFRHALLALEGDVGGRNIIEANPDAVALIETDDSGTVRDMDSRDDYERAAGQGRSL